MCNLTLASCPYVTDGEVRIEQVVDDNAWKHNHGSCNCYWSWLTRRLLGQKFTCQRAVLTYWDVCSMTMWGMFEYNCSSVQCLCSKLMLIQYENHWQMDYVSCVVVCDSIDVSSEYWMVASTVYYLPSGILYRRLFWATQVCLTMPWFVLFHLQVESWMYVMFLNLLLLVCTGVPVL